jgi:hypothetical protein
VTSLADLDTCPECDTDLRGDPIPEELHEFYGKGSTHFRRVIGVEYAYGSPERYDGVSEWRCPDCGYREGRWTGKPLADGETEPRFGGE